MGVLVGEIPQSQTDGRQQPTFFLRGHFFPGPAVLATFSRSRCVRECLVIVVEEFC